MNWNGLTIIQHIYSKLLNYTSIFYKLRVKVPVRILLNVYYAFLHPHLLYAIEAYGNTCSSYIDKLSKLNNKLLRILQHKPFRSHVPDLYLEFNTLPVSLLHEQQLQIKPLRFSPTIAEGFVSPTVVSLFLNTKMEELLKSVFMYQSCRKNNSGTFLWTTIYNVHAARLRGLMRSCSPSRNRCRISTIWDRAPPRTHARHEVRGNQKGE